MANGTNMNMLMERAAGNSPYEALFKTPVTAPAIDTSMLSQATPLGKVAPIGKAYAPGVMGNVLKNPAKASKDLGSLYTAIANGTLKGAPPELEAMAISHVTGNTPKMPPRPVDPKVFRKSVIDYFKSLSPSKEALKGQKSFTKSLSKLPGAIGKGGESFLKKLGRGDLKTVAALAILEIGAGYFISEFAASKNEKNMASLMRKYGPELQSLAVQNQHAQASLGKAQAMETDTRNALMSQLSPSFQSQAQPQIPPELIQAMSQQQSLASGQTLI